MRVLLLSVLVVSLVGFLIFSNGGTEAKAEGDNSFIGTYTFVTYTDPENRFSIEYPINWIIKKTENGGLYFEDESARGDWIDIGIPHAFGKLVILHSTNIGMSEDSANLLYAKIVAEKVLKTRMGQGMSFDSPNETKIIKLDKNRKAFFVKSNWLENNVKIGYYENELTSAAYRMASMTVLIPNEGTDWYIMTEGSDSIDHYNIFLRMIKSFRLLGTPDSIQVPTLNPTTVTHQSVYPLVTQITQPEPFDPYPIFGWIIIVGLCIIIGIVVVVIKDMIKK